MLCSVKISQNSSIDRVRLRCFCLSENIGSGFKIEKGGTWP